MRSSVQHAPGHVHNCAPNPFAEAFWLWAVGRVEMLDDHLRLAVVTVVVGDDCTTKLCSSLANVGTILSFVEMK